MLTVQNPFNIDGSGGKAADYVDMIGVTNDSTDQILGYEGPTPPAGIEPFRISKQVSVRRVSLVDTDVNAADFAMVAYASISAEEKEIKTPKNRAIGSWTPFPAAVQPDDPPEAAENTLLIWQVGATNPSSMGAVSHSFVELYNAGPETVDLNTYSLQYAEGGTVEDGEWNKIDLEGSIAPSHSFLILGNGYTPVGNQDGVAIANGSGDMNEPFDLNNNAFKVALISNRTLLTVQNPFNTDGHWTKVSGYVDMLGAINSGSIHGYEQEFMPKISKQQTARRVSLTDTDNNADDFINVDYRTTSTAVGFRTPKNHAYGAWDPVTGVKEGEEPEGPYVLPGTQDSLAGSLLILQAYGSNSSAAGASHSFVELYNKTAGIISLDGITLYYADGTSVGSGQTNQATSDPAWKQIALSGEIPAGGSFLILGPRESSGARYQIPSGYGDINDPAFSLSNRAFKAAIIRNSDTLAVQNPYTMDGDGRPADGFIDLVGAANDYQGRDLIFGFKTLPARCSASEAIRRKGLSDTGNNSADFIAARYALDGMTDAELEVRHPRNAKDNLSGWDPFAETEEPEEPPPPTESEKLMILQANIAGNYNNGAAGFAYSLVELYNNTNADINFDAGNYYLHIGDALNWTYSIKLAGSIPHQCSFLIVSSTDANTDITSATPGQGRAVLPAADQTAEFALINNNFKVALLKNQPTLSAANPFTEPSLSASYIDMLGAVSNTGVTNGYETAPASQSRPQGPRRTSLIDTDNNSVDFSQVDYRGYTASTGMPDSELYKYWPRNTALGAWNPITGLKKIDPSIPAAPPPPAATESKTLMILQANPCGNNNSAALGSGFARSVVELYNNSGEGIDLDAGNYYLHIGNATTWTNQIKLEGFIPSKCSYLVVDNSPGTEGINVTPRATLPAADQYAEFILGNGGFKVAVLRNRSAPLSVDNPFGNPGLADDYVDMLGTSNNNGSTNGYETAPVSGGTKPQVPRRKSLLDTDNNAVDFGIVDYRGTNDANLPASELYKYWPRNTVLGPWNPTDGLPRIDPNPPNYSSELAFSLKSGLYPSPIKLELTAPAGSAIYYSRDGSIPSPEKVGNGNVFKYNDLISITDTDHNGKTDANVLATKENTEQMYIKNPDPYWNESYPTMYIPTKAQVPKAAVIRAIAVDTGGRKSDVITRTYFTTNSLAKYASNPIISLVSDPDNLVSTETGIMVRGKTTNAWIKHPVNANSYNFLQDWEREAFMEIFYGDANSRDVGLSTGVGIRVRGGHSRESAQKSLNVYFRQQYGINNLKNYDLIPGAVKADGTPLRDYKSFMLRNGGNDVEWTKIYDSYSQDLVSDRSFDTQAQIPCIVFLNGEYWGPYNLGEKYGNNHAEYKFGVNKDNVIAVKNDELVEGNTGEYKLFENMIAAGTKTMSDQKNYDDFCKIVDIDNLIDYYASQLYLYNYDWPEWNYRLWRTRVVEPGNPYGDTKWRWQVFDMDGTLGFVSNGALKVNGRDAFDLIIYRATANKDYCTRLFKALLANESFCRKFVNNIMDLYNVNLQPNNWSPKLDYYNALFNPLMNDYYARWGGYNDWFPTCISRIRGFMSQIRNEVALNNLPKYFGSDYPLGSGSGNIPNIGINTGGMKNVTLSTTTSGASIKINTITPDLTGNWTGQYYAGNPVTVTAIAPAGFVFDKWNVTGGSAAAAGNSTTTVTITADATIEAVFK